MPGNIYGSGFSLTGNRVVGDYINAWAAHKTAHEFINLNLQRSKPIGNKSFQQIFKAIETYEQYLLNNHPKVIGQVLKDSDSSNVRK